MTFAEGVKYGISIHALRKECDSLPSLNVILRTKISIHALRKECDANQKFRINTVIRFLSTHSVRSATNHSMARPND